MGDSITEGVVESYVKSKCSEAPIHPEPSSNLLFSLCVCIDVGEFVEADEVVARIETDKVTVDILS